MHTLARGTAAVSCYHCAVGRLVKFHAEIIEPFYSLRRIANELCEQFALCRIVTAAESIDKMDSGRIIGFISRLNSALCHHRIGIAYAQLCDNHRLCAGIIRLYCRGSTCAATTDDEYIDIICDIREVYVTRLYAAVRLQHFAKLMRNSLALICTDSESCKFALLIVGMISREERVLFIRSHAGRLICDIFFSCGFDSGKRFLKFL
ncbi:unknown [Candidatus Apopatosoma intestinale]|nr:unknown [Candidatus Apopatosoma intestinale]